MRGTYGLHADMYLTPEERRGAIPWNLIRAMEQESKDRIALGIPSYLYLSKDEGTASA